MILLTAEDDVVVTTRRAGEGASSIVLGIAVRLWALPLEEFGIIWGRAVVEVGARAAVFRLIESSASTFAPISYFQFWRADCIYVAAASYFLAIRIGRSSRKRDIETINQRDVIEILTHVLIECILKKSCRDSSIALTFEQPPAVTSVAPAMPAGVEGAAGTTPDSGLRCSCGNVESPRLALPQRLTAARICSCPDSVCALVLHCECGAIGNLQINIDGE